MKIVFLERAPPSSKRRSQKRARQTSRKIIKRRGALSNKYNMRSHNTPVMACGKILLHLIERKLHT